MSGHSKWANIQHRKNAQDKKRGKVFSKLIRELTVAARTGGENPDTNPRLRLAIDRALSENMTKDTMERAIERAAGGSGDAPVEEITYEGYGPHGVAVLVKCISENRNRTVSEVRHAFTRMGGHLGSTGSVSYLFAEKGVLIFEPGVDEERVMDEAIEAGAEDVIVNDDHSIEVITAPADYTAVKDALIKAGIEPAQSMVTQLPATRVELEEEARETIIKLIDHLEDLDDVQEVFSNAAL